MPNRNYQRGKSFERRVASIYERMGWFAQMSAGSHGVDVVAMAPLEWAVLPYGVYAQTQAKHFTHCRNWKSRGRMSPEERQAAIEQASRHGAVPMLAYKITKGPFRGWTRCEEVV